MCWSMVDKLTIVNYVLTNRIPILLHVLDFYNYVMVGEKIWVRRHHVIELQITMVAILICSLLYKF